MKRFIKKITLFLLFVFLTVGIILPKRRIIIPFTQSESLDLKIYELRQREFDTISTIAVGSSMTLNNLNSTAWVQSTADTSFYNISSWGQTIMEDCQIIRAIVPLYNPSRIVIFAHCTDFRDSEIKNISEIETYLQKGSYPLKYFFDMMSIYTPSNQLYGFFKNDTLSYNNLNYDSFGGVALNVYGSHIDDTRWNSMTDFVFDRNNKCYAAMSELCTFLKERDIDFILVNTPARLHYYGKRLDDAYKHIHYCDSIITERGQLFIDEMDFQAYPDSLFADCSHLNSLGASMLTKNVCRKLHSLRVGHLVF